LKRFQVGQKARSLVLEAFNDGWKIYLRCFVWSERFFETYNSSSNLGKMCHNSASCFFSLPAP